MKRSRFIPHLSSALVAALISMSLLQNAAYAAENSAPIVPAANVSNQSITWNDAGDHPRMLQGALSSSVHGESEIFNYLSSNTKLYGFSKPQNDLHLIKKDSDSQGKQHYLLQQSYKGIPVYGKYMRAHVDASNQLYAVTNQSIPELNDLTLDITPAISASQASATLVAAVEQTIGQSITLGGSIGPRQLKDPTAELIIYPVDDQYLLAYRVNLEYLQPSYNQWDGFIDANTGAILEKNSKLEQASTTGTGTGFYNDTKALNIFQETNVTYNLQDKTKPMYQNINNHETGVIATYDLQKQFEGPIWSTSTNFTDSAAVDAHYNAGIVYDYYHNKLNRNSIDDKGMDILSFVNAGAIDNAFWDGYEMLYGDGSTTFSCLSCALDVVAHELTHGVTQYTAGLDYSYQSGALNESLSDIMAVVIENKDWTIGETTGIIGGNRILRDLQDPSKGLAPQPSAMSGYVKLPLDNDHGGVHLYSGIPNHAAYLIGTGIEQINGLQGQGKTLLGQIVYGAMTSYLTPTSNFIDARDAFVLAAGDLTLAPNLKTALIQAVKDAWAAVGLGYADTVNNNIVYFKTANMVGEPAINSTAHTVTFQVANGTSLNNLTPAISVSPGATITPGATAPQNFTTPVQYTVKSQLGVDQPWTIQGFVVPAITYNEILDFAVDQQTGPAVIDPINHRVTFYVESNVDVTALTPTIDIAQKATISPASRATMNFNTPVTYSVISESGAIQPWIITCVKDSISPKLAYASSVNNNQIILIFDKIMDSASLNNFANYRIESLDKSISNPLVSSITVDCIKFDRVILNTTNLVSDNAYKITVSNASSSNGYSVRPDWNTGYFLVADTKAPVLSTAVVSGSQLVLTFNEYIDYVSSLFNYSNYQVKVNGTAVPVIGSISASRRLTLTLSTPVVKNDNVVISYTPLDSYFRIKDLSQNQLPPFTDRAVTNRTAPPALLSSNGWFHYDKPIKQIIKHPTQPIVYAIFQNSDKVISANMDTGELKNITMPYQKTPDRIFYANNQLYVTLIDKPHSSYWYEPYLTGSIAILDANLMTKTSQFNIDIDPYDIVVDTLGSIYVTSGSGQWTYLKSYSKTSLTEIDKISIRQASFMVYNSILNRIYTITTDSSPTDITTYHLDSGGHFTDSRLYADHDSPYHGDYPMYPPLSVSPDGQFLFNGTGTIFTSNAQKAADMYYVDKIDGYDDIAFDLPNNKFYTVKANILKIYTYTTRQVFKTITLSQTAVGLLKGSHLNELLIVYAENGGDSTSVVSTYVQSNGISLVSNSQAGYSSLAPADLVQALNVNPCYVPSGGNGGNPPPPPSGPQPPPPPPPGVPGPFILIPDNTAATPTATPTPTPTPVAPKGTPSPSGQMGKDTLVVEIQTDAFGRTSSNIKPNAEKLLDALKSAQSGSEQYEKEHSSAIVPSIVIPIDGTSDRANVEIPAKLFADANQQAPNAVIVMKSALASYTLPVQLLTSQSMKAAFGNTFDINNSKINMTIEKTNDSLSNQIKQKMASDGYTTLSDSINFTLSVESNGKTVEIVDLHGTYVVRSIVLPTNVNSTSVSALVFDPLTNESSFVPAVVRIEAGKTIVDIKSPHNSIYTLVDAAKTFDDIAKHWAKADIEIMASKKIVLGTTERTFMPEQLITRAEFATFLVRTLGLLLPQPNVNFKDVNTTDWYARSIAAAAQAGLVTGYADGTFAPNGTITRQEMAVMVSRAMKYAGGAQTSAGSAPIIPRLTTFKDSSKVQSWATNDIEQLLANGIMAGVSKTQFAPTESVTRAQAVTALKHMLQQLKFIN